VGGTFDRDVPLLSGMGTPQPDVRCAVRQALHLIFAGFDADQAVTRAWDNTASLRVTRSLPYADFLSGVMILNLGVCAGRSFADASAKGASGRLGVVEGSLGAEAPP
jgi:hypothetical protein